MDFPSIAILSRILYNCLRHPRSRKSRTVSPFLLDFHLTEHRVGEGADMGASGVSASKILGMRRYIFDHIWARQAPSQPLVAPYFGLQSFDG